MIIYCLKHWFWSLKWIDGEQGRSSAISRYWSRTACTIDEKQILVASILPPGTIRDAMSTAFAIATNSVGPAVLLEVEEPGNPRRSGSSSDHRCGHRACLPDFYLRSGGGREALGL